MLRDMRFAIRMLLKQPAFSSIAVLTLALGIGATSAVFSLIQGVLLTPPPYPKPEQITLIMPAKADGQAYPFAWQCSYGMVRSGGVPAARHGTAGTRRRDRWLLG